MAFSYLFCERPHPARPPPPTGATGLNPPPGGVTVLFHCNLRWPTHTPVAAVQLHDWDFAAHLRRLWRRSLWAGTFFFTKGSGGVDGLRTPGCVPSLCSAPPRPPSDRFGTDDATRLTAERSQPLKQTCSSWSSLFKLRIHFADQLGASNAGRRRDIGGLSRRFSKEQRSAAGRKLLSVDWD